MNAIRVSNRAGRRLGITLIAILLPATQVKASEVVVTVTGTINGGGDSFNTFGLGGNMPKGTPYTIVFTFDDSKGQAMPLPCLNSGSGLAGGGQGSPGTAVVTINGKSYEFGKRPDARSRIWRRTATLCSDSEIGMAIQEGHWSQPSGVNIKITPNQGRKSLTQDKDWRAAVSLSDFEAKNGDNSFAIRRPGNYGAQTMSYLSVSTMTISGPRAGKPKEAKPEVKAPVKPSVPNHGLRPITGGPEISKIYVLSTDRACMVTTFTPTGQKIAPEFYTGMGTNCSGIAVHPGGKLYVSGALSLQLRTFLPDGTPTPPVINGGFGTNALALDALGRLFMLLPGEDRNNGFIRVFTPEMKQAMPPIVTHLSLADGIALDPSGKIYVISQGDNVIKTYDASGKQTEPTIREGMKGPRAIAVGPDGKIYAANFTTVTTYYPDGERTPQTITHINREGGGPDSPMSLALDAKGRLYIGYHSGLVWIINPDGKSAGEGFMARRFIQGIALR